jgi:hypothetical protein
MAGGVAAACASHGLTIICLGDAGEAGRVRVRTRCVAADGVQHLVHLQQQRPVRDLHRSNDPLWQTACKEVDMK